MLMEKLKDRDTLIEQSLNMPNMYMLTWLTHVGGR